MAQKGFTHIDPFNDNSGGWTLSNATISGGILDITASTGSGQRSPDADWLSGSTNDFIIEANVRLQGGAGERIWRVNVGLIDGGAIYFEYRAGATDQIRLHYPLGTVRANQAEAIDNDNWHSVKVRRVGTVYYFSVDGHSEISYDVGTEYAVSVIQLYMENNVGDFDNFKYSWTEVVLEGAINFSGDISRTLNFKRTSEGSISFIGTLQRKLSLKRLFEGNVSFIGTLKIRRLWKAISKMSNIWTPQDKRDNDWTKE